MIIMQIYTNNHNTKSTSRYSIYGDKNMYSQLLRSLTIFTSITIALCGISFSTLSAQTDQKDQTSKTSPPNDKAPNSTNTPKENNRNSTNPYDNSPNTTPSQSPTPSTDHHRFKLITIEEQVNSVKEKVFHSKARLLLLQATLLQSAISTSQLKLIQNNQMGAGFYLESASYFINGTPAFTRTDQDGSLNNQKVIVLYQGSIKPGPCRINVELRYRGGSRFFGYMRNYRFRMRSSYTVKVEEGKLIEIQIIPYQKGWTVEYTKRPAIRYQTQIHNLSQKKEQLQKIPQNKKSTK
jgi:hypothetical protein